jgi:hypothetical protein
MKGGITSGILYPPAICQIAEGFDLVGIAGTSAGAIAACTAAAAEYRRRRGSAVGFEMLEKLSTDLARDLRGLFRPDSGTKALYNLAADGVALGDHSGPARWLWKARMAWAVLHRE